MFSIAKLTNLEYLYLPLKKIHVYDLKNLVYCYLPTGVIYITYKKRLVYRLYFLTCKKYLKYNFKIIKSILKF